MIPDIDAIHQTAESFIKPTLANFDPFQWETHRKSELRRKSFNELSMYWYVVETRGSGGREIETHVTERVNDPRYSKLLHRYPKRLIQNGFAPVAIDALGELDPGSRRSMDGVYRNDEVWSTERLPFETVTAVSLCRMWGCEQVGPSLETAMHVSNLQMSPDPIRTDLREYYNLTHNVMIPVAFGAGHPNSVSAPLSYDLRQSITAGILRAIADGNADLTLELVKAGVLQNQLPDWLVRYAVRWVAEEKLTQSHVVAPTTDEADSESTRYPDCARLADEWDEETQRWATHYHANIVAASTAVLLRDTSISVDGTISLDDPQFGGLVTLGSVLNRLHDYDLAGAAGRLVDLDPSVVRQYPELSRRILSFYRSQEREKTDTGTGLTNDDCSIVANRTKPSIDRWSLPSGRWSTTPSRRYQTHWGCLVKKSKVIT